MSTRVSAYISDETKAEAEAFVKKYGMTMARLIEEALQHHLQALREIPSDLVVPSRVVVTAASMKRVAARGAPAGRAGAGLRWQYVPDPDDRRPARVATGCKDIYGYNRNRALTSYVLNQDVEEISLDDPQAVFKAVNPALCMVRVDARDDRGQYLPLAAYSTFSVHATALTPPRSRAARFRRRGPAFPAA